MLTGDKANSGVLLSGVTAACVAVAAAFSYFTVFYPKRNSSDRPHAVEEGNASDDQTYVEPILQLPDGVSDCEIDELSCDMGFANEEDRWAKLASVQEDVLQRLAILENAVKRVLEAEQLKLRQLQILERTAALEAEVNGRTSNTSTQVKSHDATDSSIDEKNISQVQARLARVLRADGLTSFRFVRAPPDYYSQPLEFRKGVVGAASVDHLCKSIVMQNTRAPDDLTDCADPCYSKYYMVFVQELAEPESVSVNFYQYTAKLHAEKLHNFVRNLAPKAGRSLSKKQVNMRLVPEEVNTALTGFEHNAVAPIGTAVKIPMIISHKIANLEPDFFWLGGGEVDLKLGLSWSEFNSIYSPFIADCTYE